MTKLLLFVFALSVLVVTSVVVGLTQSNSSLTSSRYARSSAATIVTAYYEFPSKHPSSNYHQWIQNMIGTIENPMVIFCENEEWRAKLTTWRQRHMHQTKIILRPWETMRCSTYLDYFQKDWERDSEKDIHNPKLYILWNEKTAMVDDAIRLNPFGSSFYCWCDIGAFRNADTLQHYKKWPHPDFINTAVTDKLYLLQVGAFDDEDVSIGLPPQFGSKQRVGGGIMLGHVNAWTEWTRHYYQTLEAFIAADYFAGKDQNIMATVAIKYPSSVHLVTYNRPAQYWFYLEPHFLGLSEEEAFQLL